MTDTVLMPTATGDRTSMQRPLLAAVGLSTVMTVALLVRDTNDGPVWRVGSILVGAIALFTALVFGFVVRRTLAKRSATSSARAALILSLVSVLSVAVFWMALPPVFAVGAIALGQDARDRRPFRGERTAAVAVGLAALATAAGLVLSVLG